MTGLFHSLVIFIVTWIFPSVSFHSLPQRIPSSSLTSWEEERRPMMVLDLPGQFHSKIYLLRLPVPSRAVIGDDL